MAPESERAKMEKCPNCGKSQDAPDPFGCEAVFHWSDEQLAKVQQPPAPASCSEVVERLQKCAFIKITRQDASGSVKAFLDTEKAAAILHEWREQIRKGAKHE